MKTSAPRPLMDPLPRRDILAICVFLNRHNGPKSADSCVSKPGVFLDKLAAAARMQ